ncbi:MAG: leucine-rich repeat domain-containing protein [Gammaproteobacteria bacterium]|nr:leucine-rich repeat domain-containing protein [Gammaproteobacteria bacterium]
MSETPALARLNGAAVTRVTTRALLLLATLAAHGASGERLGDFDGDGRADVLLRHADGSWRYHGSSASGSPGEPVRMTRKPEWYWAGAGDFNGDGNDDALVRRTDGAWLYYPVDGSRVIVEERGWANLTRNLDFRVAGVGDFNGDGRDDILMRRTDGAWVYYPLNGRRVVAAERGWANLPRNVDWRMAGTGDFDGDGRTDVLLRHVEGEWRYYAMDGRRVVADRPNGTRLTQDPLWQFAGTGDFDGDGRDEVLLRHADGRWQFGAIDDEAARVADLDRDWAWRLVGIGDSDGDGRDDILLRHDGGRWLWHRGRAGQAQPALSHEIAWAMPARPVYFPDPALRTAVEDALGKAAGGFIRPRELAALDTLVADFAGITDLTGIGFAVGLSWLNVEFNRIQDIVPLAGLVGLQSLYLRSSRVADIAPLAYLPALRVLDLGDNRVTDVSALAGLVALRFLALDLNHGQHTGHAGAGIEDIGPLAGLTRLTRLDLSFNRIRDVSPLAGLTSLASLDLFQNLVVDITPLGELTGLSHLSLARNRIEDVSTLARFTALTSLWVGENDVSDWSPLAGLTQLTGLGLWDSGVEDLSVLAELTELRRLHLEDNDIEDVSVLANLPWLTRLELDGNRIADIGPLRDLTRLTRLHLDRNRIADLSPLAGLLALEWLTLGSNAIGDVSPLAGLTALEVLDLDRNRIVDIAPLEQLTRLKELRLAFNRIADLTPLANNPGLGEGDLVDVRGNPLNAASVATAVPALLARGVHVEASPPPRLAAVHDDRVVVLHVGEDIAALDLFSGLPLDAYSSALYAHFGDAFDFVMFFSNLDDLRDHDDSHYVGVYSSVRNDTAGLGLRMFYDNRYGSAKRLKGVIHFPYNRALLFGPALHEMLHAWANYAIPSAAEAHWGFSSADGQLGGFDIANLVELGDGRYAAGEFGTFANGGNRPPYSPIELYFAGYLPPEEVPDLWVAADGEWLVENGSPARTQDGQRVFSASEVRTYTIEDIVARNGARVPAMADAQWHFRVAAVLLTNDEHPASAAQLGLLSDHAALFSRRGSDGREAHNFFEATGGRGSVAMDGLAQFRKAAPAAVRDLPESYGVVPAPRASMVEGRSGPLVRNRRD